MNISDWNSLDSKTCRVSQQKYQGLHVTGILRGAVSSDLLRWRVVKWAHACGCCKPGVVCRKKSKLLAFVSNSNSPCHYFAAFATPMV